MTRNGTLKSVAMPQYIDTGTSLVDAAVKVNHEVITDAPEAALLVPGIDVGDREVLAFRSRGTMNDNL